MDISNLGNTMNLYSPTAAQGVSTSQVSGGGADGDSGRVHHGRGHGRGGQMQQAMMEALQSMGLAMPQQAGGAGAAGTNTSTSAGGGDSDGDADGGGSSATSSIKNDMRQFMHALFQSIRSENSAGTTSASQASGSGDSSTNFAAGLSALISTVSNGTAPTDLQTAFNTLAADLQASSSSSTTGGGSSGTGAGNAQATLQAFLTQLQQNLGYGASTSASTGNVISTSA